MHLRMCGSGQLVCRVTRRGDETSYPGLRAPSTRARAKPYTSLVGCPARAHGSLQPHRRRQLVSGHAVSRKSRAAGSLAGRGLPGVRHRAALASAAVLGSARRAPGVLVQVRARFVREGAWSRTVNDSARDHGCVNLGGWRPGGRGCATGSAPRAGPASAQVYAAACGAAPLLGWGGKLAYN